jgi:hypothetical protein
LSLPCLCQSSSDPTIFGYVTNVALPTSFDVNGKHILIDGKTSINMEQPQLVHGNPTYSSLPVASTRLYLGEPVDVFGEYKGRNSIAATRVFLHARAPRPVSGTAIIDAIPAASPGSSASTDRFVRADGYSILIPSTTELAFQQPLSSPSDIQVNVWIKYSGTQRPDGVVVANKASFSKNVTSRGLDKARERFEYDPGAVDPDSHQGLVDKAFRGLDPRKFPPHKDAAMQSRVDATGAKLVPRYQSEFPYTEETRIDFRFYLLDAPKWRDAVPLPNGIILVPYQLVERMQNDSQLATLLADKVACLLEKQPVALPASNGDLAKGAAVDTAVAVVPFASLAATAAAIPVSISANNQFHRNQEQRERVSVGLLHDAGYDITQAPLAWWLLAPRKPKDIADTPIPERVAYLYEFLGETWPAQP